MKYHENKLRIHQIIFLICFIFALISPDYNQEIVQAKSKEKTSSGMEREVYAPVSSTGKTNGKEKSEEGISKENSGSVRNIDGQTIQRASGISCDAECKQKHLENIGIDMKLAKPLVENCKRIATDARHCIIAGASVITAESGGKLKNCYHKNCTGLGAGKIWYETYEAGIIDWIIRYQKYWYKAKSASFFYPSVGEKSKSRYCTSENSSGSAVGCPNGQKSAQSTWNKLSKLF